MKIGIVTHNIHHGYGGTLQAFALQTVLRKLGHEPVTLRSLTTYTKEPIKSMLDNKLRRAVKLLIGRDVSITHKQHEYVCQESERFVKKHINVTPLNRTKEDFRRSALNEHCEAFIVGSDQIWRKRYPFLYNTFLDFTEGMNVKRLTYAASFAIDDWEFTPEQTERMKQLAKSFDAVSVREASGVNLCKEHLNRPDAKHVLDPTLMLDKEEYIKTVEEAGEEVTENGMFTYILDKTPEKEAFVNSIADKANLHRFECDPQLSPSYKNVRRNPKACIYPPITKWLRCFMDAKMVVTDSFHGTAFSIIFNIPFYVILNKQRGASRFISMLNLFGLSDRIVNSLDEVDVNKEISWEKVNSIKKTWQERSLEFLFNALK